jgi:hypothetical protein
MLRRKAEIIEDVTVGDMGWLVKRLFHVFSPQPNAL